jgi:predicted AAA+ superfamily ATPase
MMDSEAVDVFLSGSSARRLSREVATSMSGRAVEAIVYPFSFAEVLRHLGGPEPEDPGFLRAAERSEIENLFRDYVVVGGFPEVQGMDARLRRSILQGYVDVVILRDIAERHGLTNLTAIRWLTRQLLANAGGPFSANRFHRDLHSQKVRVSVEGILSIFSFLEDAFLVHGVPIETASERQRQVNPRKGYPVDPGLIPVFDRTGRANLGHGLETAVLVELLRRGAEVTWVKTPGGFEIDFLARYPEGGMELVQVCASLEDPATAEREFRAFSNLGSRFPEARRLLLTMNREMPSLAPDGSDVEVLPAYEWMLAGAAPGLVPN